MSKNIFYLMALAISPVIADVAPPVHMAEATHVQIIEKKTSEAELEDQFDQTRSIVEKFAHANANVLKQFDRFKESLQKSYSDKSMSKEDVELVLQGVAFAAEKHQAQTRKNADHTPYIIHPIGVADSIVRIGGVHDAKILVAALLHDTVEDTDTTFEEISKQFGDKIADYVKEVTDDKSLPTRARKKMQIIHAFHKSKGAAIIKLSDKLYNLNNLLQDPPKDWTRERIDQYFQWAQTVIENLPSANDDLKQAVHDVIAEYWEKQAAK
jgi:guanosine-3',5'-bis(diphosphate) 3'-pyrophosphohydrolase